MSLVWLLYLVIGFGSFVDAIAGGGGLITLTAYVAFGLPPAVALGTNKFAASCGTLVASSQYIRRRQVSWKTGVPAMVLSFLGSALGTALAARYAEAYLHYVLVVLVPALALFMLFTPDFGSAKERPTSQIIVFAALCGLVVGAYDGFFGPGTGTFLTLFFTALVGLDLLKAAGTARVVNFCSNLASLAVFLLNGAVDMRIAIPCALSSVIGGYLGSRLALKVGSNVVKPVMLFVLLLLLGKVAASLF